MENKATFNGITDESMAQVVGGSAEDAKAAIPQMIATIDEMRTRARGNDTAILIGITQIFRDARRGYLDLGVFLEELPEKAQDLKDPVLREELAAHAKEWMAIYNR